MLDVWEMVPLVVKAPTGGLTWTHLFEQQQEARTLFPKLIFIILSVGKYLDGPDVAKTWRSSEQLLSGWRAVFPRDTVPPGAEISAWAVDVKDAKLYRLQARERMFN